MAIRQVAATVVLLLFSILATSAPSAKTYKSDPDSLSAVHKEMYLDAQQFLANQWKASPDKLARVIGLIDKLIAEDPDFLPAYLEKAELILIRSARPGSLEANQAALDIILEVQRKDPSYGRPYRLAGAIYTTLGEYENAEKHLEIAREKAAEDPWTYISWATLLVLKGQRTKAVEYARKALTFSKGDRKAVVTALYRISRSSRESADPQSTSKIISFLFHHFKEPTERLKIAETLIHTFSAHRDLLNYAHEILLRQNKETPDLAEARLQLAGFYLTQGRISTTDHIVNYDRYKRDRAEKLLAPIADNESVRERVFDLRVNIAVSARDFKKARRIIEHAQKEALIPEKRLLKNLGYLQYAEGKLESAIETFERLGWSLHPIQLSSYKKLGRIDKLHEYQKKLVAANPDHAWTLGNYAWFLLSDLGDVEGAIEFGKRALDKKDYPMARRSLALAYLVQASKLFKSGDVDESWSSYQLARNVGIDRAFIKTYCRQYCSDIEEFMASVESGAGQSQL